MDYEDRVTIATPEGVDLELTLAGIGSRFTAAGIDFAIQILIVLSIYVVLIGLNGFGTIDAEGFQAAAFIIVSFVLFAGYDIAFEVLASGRTPGKRWNGLRVVREGGHPVTFVPSAIRNVLRLVDILPGMYIVGSVAILTTRMNQRVGDVVGGTLVIRDRLGDAKDAPRPARQYALTAPPSEDLVGWDVGTITPEELSTVRHFLDRRYDLEQNARIRLAATLAERLKPKVAGAPADVGDEPFLEGISRAKAERS